MNMREALTAWTKWIDAGRPTGKDLRKMLFRTLTNSKSKVSNAMNALEDRPLWPALSKNRSFKSPSFDKNLQGWLDYATNDCWMGLFGGVSETALSNPTSYHPLSVAIRAAADELTKEGMGDWKTAEAQAAIWTFTKVFQETGETDPAIVRQMSQDFVDIMAHDSEVQDLLAQLGVKHEQLAARLEAIGEKPEITGRTTPTSSDSIKRLGERLKKAGRAAPERLAGTSFVPGDFEEVPSLENVTVSKLGPQDQIVKTVDLNSAVNRANNPLSRQTPVPRPSKGLQYPANLTTEEAQDLQRLVQQMKERGASEKERQSFVDDWAKNARPKPVVPGMRSITADVMDHVFGGEKKPPMTPEQHAAAKNAAATPETKFRHAVHEVGHIIGAMGEGFPDHGGIKVGYQPVPDYLKEYANQLGTDIMGGAARIPMFPNTPQGRRAYVRTLMAGGVAEVMMTGTPTPGDYGDIQIAAKFLKGLGMSDEAIDEELFQARAYLVKSFGPKVRDIMQHAAQEVADHHYGSDVLPSVLDHYLMGKRYEDVMPQSPKR
jgi:hypothetical protein